MDYMECQVKNHTNLGGGANFVCMTLLWTSGICFALQPFLNTHYVPLIFFVYKSETQSGQSRYYEYIDKNVWPVKSGLAILPRQSK
jgi:hypothetical protein